MQASGYFILLISLGTSCVAAGQSVSIISNLNQKLLEKQKSEKPYRNTPPVIDVPELAPVKHQKLSERISFLTDGKMTVMIPKGALIHAPKNDRISVQEKIQGKLVEWDEFFQANRNAIRLEPVDADQLQGITPINPKVLQQAIRVNLPTLASYHNRVVALPAPK